MLTQRKTAEVGASTVSIAALAGGSMSNHCMEMTMTTDNTAPDSGATPPEVDMELMASLAATDWQAWEGRPEDSDVVPTSKAYHEGPAIQLRMCLMVMHKTKPELVKIAKDMWDQPGMQDGDENMWDGFVENIKSAKIFAECMLELATGAEARCYAAIATLAMEGGE